MAKSAKPEVTASVAFNGNGHIDWVDDRTIAGWCCDLNNLDASLVLEVRSSGGKSIFAVADIYRKDIQEAKFGNGRHGFLIDIMGLALNNETVSIYYADDGSTLNKIPIDLDPERMLLNANIDLRFSSSLKLAAAKTKQNFQKMAVSGYLAR